MRASSVQYCSTHATSKHTRERDSTASRSGPCNALSSKSDTRPPFASRPAQLEAAGTARLAFAKDAKEGPGADAEPRALRSTLQTIVQQQGKKSLQKSPSVCGLMSGLRPILSLLSTPLGSNSSASGNLSRVFPRDCRSRLGWRALMRLEMRSSRDTQSGGCRAADTPITGE